MVSNNQVIILLLGLYINRSKEEVADHHHKQEEDQRRAFTKAEDQIIKDLRERSHKEIKIKSPWTKKLSKIN